MFLLQVSSQSCCIIQALKWTSNFLQQLLPRENKTFIQIFMINQNDEKLTLL